VAIAESGKAFSLVSVYPALAATILKLTHQGAAPNVAGGAGTLVSNRVE